MTAHPGPITRRRLLGNGGRWIGGLAATGAAARFLAACADLELPAPASAPAINPFGRGLQAIGARDAFTLGPADPARRWFYYAVVSDPHIADEIYFAEDGIEGNARDTASMRDTVTNLTAARDFLNPLAGVLDAVFVPGDVVHNYPTVELGYDRPEDMAFYERTRTRFDIAAEILNGFEMPVFVGWGNHDYDVGKVDRAFSEELFLAKFNAPPYYAVDHRGVRFIHLNNFRGATQTPGNPLFDPGIGSFGETQLAWFDAQFEAGLPIVVFVHYAPGLPIIQRSEVADLDLYTLLTKHAEQILHVISGHTHIWIDFGREIGPPHQVVGATRYTPNAYAIVEVDTQTATQRFVNADLWRPLQHEAKALDREAFLAEARSRLTT